MPTIYLLRFIQKEELISTSKKFLWDSPSHAILLSNANESAIERVINYVVQQRKHVDDFTRGDNESIYIYCEEKNFQAIIDALLAGWHCREIKKLTAAPFNPHRWFDGHFVNKEQAESIEFEVFVEKKMCQYEQWWRNQYYRRVLALCALFPNDTKRIKQFFTQPPGDTLEATAFFLAEEGCLPFENDTPQLLINASCKDGLEEWIQQQLCIQGETLDDLRDRVKLIFSGANFARELVGDNGFFTGGFVRGGKETQVKPYTKIIRYKNWAITISTPPVSSDGKLTEVSYVDELFTDATIHQDDTEVTAKVLFAPAFHPAVVERGGEQRLGIYLIDWLSLTLLRKYQDEHKGRQLNSKELEKIPLMFIRTPTVNLWSFDAGIRILEAAIKS